MSLSGRCCACSRPLSQRCETGIVTSSGTDASACQQGKHSWTGTCLACLGVNDCAHSEASAHALGVNNCACPETSAHARG